MKTQSFTLLEFGNDTIPQFSPNSPIRTSQSQNIVSEPVKENRYFSGQLFGFWFIQTGYS